MNCNWGLGSVSEDDDEAQCPRPVEAQCPRPAGTARTFGLRDVDEAAEDLAHARLQGEVLGAAGHGNDKVGRFQVPVLRQQLIEGLRVRVTGQADILRGRGKVSGSAPVLANTCSCGRGETPGPAAKAGPHRSRKESSRLGEGRGVPPTGHPTQLENSGIYPKGRGAPVRCLKQSRNGMGFHVRSPPAPGLTADGGPRLKGRGAVGRQELVVARPGAGALARDSSGPPSGAANTGLGDARSTGPGFQLPGDGAATETEDPGASEDAASQSLNLVVTPGGQA